MITQPLILRVRLDKGFLKKEKGGHVFIVAFRELYNFYKSKNRLIKRKINMLKYFIMVGETKS